MSCNKLLREALNGMDSFDVINEWTTSSSNIVRSYLDKGSHEKLDEFFKKEKPTYGYNSYRYGTVDKDLGLKKGDLVENPFPFATSKDQNLIEVFKGYSMRRASRPKENKRLVKYHIDNSEVPQYDISDVNSMEKEVIVKPKSKFIVEDTYEDDGVLNVVLKATKSDGQTKKLLGLAGGLNSINEDN